MSGRDSRLELIRGRRDVHGRDRRRRHKTLTATWLPSFPTARFIQLSFNHIYSAPLSCFHIRTSIAASVAVQFLYRYQNAIFIPALLLIDMSLPHHTHIHPSCTSPRMGLWHSVCAACTELWRGVFTAWGMDINLHGLSVSEIHSACRCHCHNVI